MAPDLVHRLLHSYGLGFVFLVLVLDSAGLPLPGETAMVAAAFYAARSHSLGPVPLFVAAAAGAVGGATLGYALGARFGVRVLNRVGPRIGYTEDRQILAHYLIDRHGAVLIAVGRFFALLRPVENLLAGATGMGFRRFMVGNVVGGVAWTGLYCFGVYLAGRKLMQMAGEAATPIGIAAAVALVGGFLLLRRQEAKLVATARAAMQKG